MGGGGGSGGRTPGRSARSVAGSSRCGRSGHDRRRVGVDGQRLPALSRIPPRRGRRGRVQRQVHVRSARAAGSERRDADRPRATHVSQLLPRLRPLGVQRPAAGPLMSADLALATTALDRLIADALGGLWNDPPRLPARWFYDDAGSRLFDEITRLPEYYPARAETEILRERSAEIARLTGATTLVELGAGTSTKTRLLLSALTADGRPIHFVPIDVSAATLDSAARIIASRYPSAQVTPVVADFAESLDDLPGEPGRRLLIFLGSTIGNLEITERLEFLERVRSAVAPGDHFLLGADLVKDARRLVAAYDDARGVTAAFNRNLIAVLRRELKGVGLRPDDFDHVAVWNVAQSRIEMRLRARRAIRAEFAVLDKEWTLEAGEEMLTEISTKFRAAELRDELADHGLETVKGWTDAAGDYLLSLTRAV